MLSTFFRASNQNLKKIDDLGILGAFVTSQFWDTLKNTLFKVEVFFDVSQICVKKNDSDFSS